MRPGTRPWWAVLPALAAAVFLVMLAIRTGGGVFGTDEYWYAGDLRMTAATDAAVSNHVYPLYPWTVAAFTDGIWRALTPRSWSQALLPVPIALGCLAGLVAGRGDRRSASVRFWAVAMLVTYVVTCGVFQPQGRYLYAAAPLAAVLLDVTAARLWHASTTRIRLVRGAVVAMAVALCTVGVARSLETARVIHVADRNADAATTRLAAALHPASSQEGTAPRAVTVIAHATPPTSRSPTPPSPTRRCPSTPASSHPQTPAASRRHGGSPPSSAHPQTASSSGRPPRQPRSCRPRLCENPAVERRPPSGRCADDAAVSEVVSSDMAMTLRLSDDEAQALRTWAERESRSMQDVAREAIREYLESRSRAALLDEVLDREVPRYAEALDRLGR